MLTLHAAEGGLLVARDGRAPVAGGAVLVDGERIAAVGSLEELRVAYPGARVRSWPGVLGPALVYEGALPDAPSARERVHAVLGGGACSVRLAGVCDPALRAAAGRVGVRVLGPHAEVPDLAPAGRADLAVFGPDGRCLATIVAGRLLHRRA